MIRTQKLSFDFERSTLDEVREFVEATQDLKGESVVLARTAISFHADGATIGRLTVGIGDAKPVKTKKA